MELFKQPSNGLDAPQAIDNAVPAGDGLVRQTG
jgi:hypothetical protein